MLFQIQKHLFWTSIVLIFMLPFSTTVSQVPEMRILSTVIYYIQKEKQSSTLPFKIRESKPNSRKATSVKNLLFCIKENKI